MGNSADDIEIITRSDRVEALLEPYRGAIGHDYDGYSHDTIYWHHKVTPFRGPNADIVNAVRKADWIDATAGIVRMGMPKRGIEKATDVIPAAGFYDTLRRIGPELTGSALGTVAGLLKVCKL